MNKLLEKIKTTYKSLVSWISQFYYRVDKIADKVAPIAIRIVNAIKDINDSTQGDVVAQIITAVIPGKKDDAIVKQLRKWLRTQLPIIAEAIGIVQNISSITDANEQLKAIAHEINFSNDLKKRTAYHTLATLLIEALADGRISWSEAVVLSEFYYSDIKNK